MQDFLPEELIDLQEFIASFPGIGAKTANRILIYLLNSPEENLIRFGETLKNLKKRIGVCPICHFLTSNGNCPFCENPERDKSLICVVEEFNDVFGIETTESYNGLYHILGGVIAPLKGKTPEKLNINSLLKRLKSGNINEVILALGMDTEGEITMYYLKDRIAEISPNIRVTRLAYGIPAGADLDFCDYKTLKAAFKNRMDIKEEDE